MIIFFVNLCEELKIDLKKWNRNLVVIEIENWLIY